MDIRTGDIYTGKTLEELCADKHIKPYMKMMELAPTVAQKLRKLIDKRAIGRVGRNDPCPCGSGKKFKYCCLVI